MGDKLNFASWIENHWLKFISFIIFIVIINYFRDDTEFLKHIWAEFAGISLGTLFALVIVDNYNNRQWKRNQLRIMNSLIHNLNEITLRMCTQLPPILYEKPEISIPLSRNRRKADYEIFEIIKETINILSKPEMADWKRHIPNGSEKYIIKNISEYIIELIRDIDRNVISIESALTPGLIRDLDDEIMEALFIIEDAKDYLMKCINDYEKGSPSNVLPSFITWVKCISNLYNVILNKVYIPEIYIC